MFTDTRWPHAFPAWLCFLSDSVLACSSSWEPRILFILQSPTTLRMWIREPGGSGTENEQRRRGAVVGGCLNTDHKFMACHGGDSRIEVYTFPRRLSNRIYYPLIIRRRWNQVTARKVVRSVCVQTKRAEGGAAADAMPCHDHLRPTNEQQREFFTHLIRIDSLSRSPTPPSIPQIKQPTPSSPLLIPRSLSAQHQAERCSRLG